MKLSDIREAVEKRYISLPIEFQDASGTDHVLNLRNVMRMPDEDQAAVDEILKTFDKLELKDARATFKRFLVILSGDEALTKVFTDTIQDDMAVMAYILETYSEVTQAEKA